MRYNDRVEIFTKKQEEYNPETGEYTSSEDEVLIVPVHVMDLGVDKQVAVFGEYKRGSKSGFISKTHLKYHSIISTIEKNAINVEQISSLEEYSI